MKEIFITNNIMELSEFIERVSLYRLDSKMYYKEGDTEEILWEKIKLFLQSERGSMSPREHSFTEYLRWQNHWKPLTYEKLGILIKEILDGTFSEVLEESDELIRFQSGTSMFRAQKFIECGDGHTWVERPIGRNDYSPIERVLGIQVSIPNGPRGEAARLYCYAEQKQYLYGDTPVVLTGLIPKRYLFKERNLGEFAISIRDYDKIVDPEILLLEEYEEKYLTI